ncbi:MAG: class III signal peptide-containing protein [Bacteriovoracaceae bacterium]|nr:class III signal peptide-containing protein [Bacteriovoracaceae bacterium]
MNQSKKKHYNGERGQVAVEYVLLLAAVTTILFSLMGQVKIYFLADQGKCKPDSTSIVCSFEKTFSLKSFRRFRILR